ncbi:MAG: type II toxin-antitoxin system RelB/DinJ family antitoxin [Candidatus Riflebacteria bacterium]|nr:type II toxin-antitoxin system RelB/DinJ family antitoxin [Candidatus Riflebacteria bacterium]
MSKTALIQTRIEPDLKSEVEAILQEIGLSTSEAVTIFLKRVKMEHGIPFDVKIPNAVTKAAMKDIEKRRNLRGPFKNSKEMIADLESDD